MSQVLILGAGLVAGPLVSYLNKEKVTITLASHIIEEAKNLAFGKENVTPITLDVSNKESLNSAIKSHQIVVSFLPFTLHPIVAAACITNKVHLVTASYRSSEMEQLDDEAKKSGITILNEMGFDPGLDHLSAMHVIDEIHDSGGHIDTFVSWGSGLPSPQFNNNPFGYKFAWAPMSVLMAMQNDAQFLKSKEIVKIDADHLLNQKIQAWTGETESFEGYPNRDSLPYIDAYGLHEVSNLMRGTLRYKGNLDIMRFTKSIGLFSNEIISPDLKWNELMSQLMELPSDQLETQSKAPELVTKALNWLGLFSNQTVNGKTFIEAYCNQLQKYLDFKSGETDMALLIHKFAYRDPLGKMNYKMSKFKLFGDTDGYSAMAKAVGTPAGIATKLILDGKISQTGSILPVSKEFHHQMLPILEIEGLSCKESLIDNQAGDFLIEI